jgi:hypothetical protein
MGYICAHCGEGLPEDTPCPCTMGYELDVDDQDVVLGPLVPEIGLGIHYSACQESPSSPATCPGECLAHRQHVYILCYGKPVVVRDRDYLHDDPTTGYPITHYVGWTSQLPPVKRVRQHGAKSAHYIAQIRPGTMRDEEHVKRFEACPKCGQSLWYYAESPTYSDDYANNTAPSQGALLQAPAKPCSQ